MKPSVITLGTFDGVHLGHQAILRRVSERARARGAASVVLAFGMPPRFSAGRSSQPVLLTTLDEKIKILKTLGLDHTEVLTFDRRTASTSAQDFFKNKIVKRWNAVEMIVGPRLAFGKKRAGRLPLLRRLAKPRGMTIEAVRAIPYRGKVISSRRIRAMLASGDVEKAAALLGRPYSAEGLVVRGDRRGRTLGFPTANIQIPADKILPRGVFWVQVRQGSGHLMNGLCNVGTRPTFHPGEQQVHCEVYLIDQRRSLYNRRLIVYFRRKIRAERRFSSADKLVQQIGKDFRRAKRMIKRFSLQNQPVPL